MEKIRNVLQDYLDDYNLTNPKEVKLVFFQDAIEHVSRYRLQGPQLYVDLIWFLLKDGTLDALADELKSWRNTQSGLKYILLCFSNKIFYVFQIFLFICLCVVVCMHACVYVHAYMYVCVWCLRWPEKDVGSPRIGATNSCELPGMGTGNETQVLWKSKQYIS